MKNNKKTKRQWISLGTFLLIAFCLIFILVIPLMQKTFLWFSNKTLKVLRPDQVVLEFDSFYSTTLKTNISKFVFSNVQKHKLSNFDLTQFNQGLKQEFKAIKSIEWNFSQPGFAMAKISGVSPFCKLNDKFIVTDDKSLLELNCFKDFEFYFAKDFYMPLDIMQSFISNKIFSFLQAIPDSIWKNYTLGYSKKNRITLCPKREKKLNNNVFMLSRKESFDEEKFYIAKTIEKDLAKQHTRKSIKNKNYLLDLRFKNRILIKESNFKDMERGLLE